MNKSPRPALVFATLLLIADPLNAQSAETTPPTAKTFRTFYVDSQTGSDAGDGLNPDRAWQSLRQVNRAELHPGDTVLLRRGTELRGQLVPRSGSANHPITYGAYGEGAKPRLLGSVSMNQADDWQQSASGIWTTAAIRFDPEKQEADLSRFRWSLYTEGGADCSLRQPTDKETSPPTYQLDCRQPGTAAYFIQFSTSGINLREGEYYAFSFRARSTIAFTSGTWGLMHNGAPFTAFAETRSSQLQIGSDWTACSIQFRAICDASDARLTWYLGGVLPKGTSVSFQPTELRRLRSSQKTPLSADVGNIIFDEGKMTGVKKWREADLKNEGDYFYDAKTWQVKLRLDANPATRFQRIELALRQHIIDQNDRAYIMYENLALSCGAAHGFGGAATDHITIRDCDLSYIGGGHQLTGADGTPVRFGNGIEFWSDASNCLVEGCRLWEIYDAALTNQGMGRNVQQNITYRRNVIWNCEYSFEFWNGGPESQTRNIRFERNTCVNAGGGWGHAQRPDPNGRHLMFYDNSSKTEGVVITHNIFAQATDSCARLHGRDWTADLLMDFNCWFDPKGRLWLWGTETTDEAGYETFRKSRKLDGHSIIADPQFVDATQHDYRLRTGSPAAAIDDGGLPIGALPVAK